MNGIEGEDITDIDVTDARDGEEVAGRKDVFPAEERGDDVLRGLRPDEPEGRQSAFWRDGFRMECPRQRPRHCE